VADLQILTIHLSQRYDKGHTDESHGDASKADLVQNSIGCHQTPFYGSVGEKHRGICFVHLPLMALFRCYTVLLLVFLITGESALYSQIDSTAPQNGLDSFLSRRKGVMGHLAEAIRADASEDKEKPIERGDKVFQIYSGRTIRMIMVQTLDFGISIGDTSKRINNSLTHLANWLHNNTKERVIHNNLFFKTNDKVSPFVLSNNERYLRNLPYIQDARIVIRPVPNHPDSVDVAVFVKDVLSLGGSVRLHSYQSTSVAVWDDNTMGWGDRLEFQTLFDQRRKPVFGYGMGYTKRNVAGSFVDLSLGYLNFSPAFNTGRREENTGYVRMTRPLVNPYSHWTWSASAEVHSTANMFGLDSIYESDWKYKYRLYDAWVGRNLAAKPISSEAEFNRFRFLVSLRLIDQRFFEKPAQFTNQYNFSFANTLAVLGGVSAYKQRFYKTSYIYGFGRHEDLPSGIDATLVSGYTIKNDRKRLYSGASFSYNYVTSHERFLNYSMAAGGSFYKGRPEDVSLMANMEYFGRLHNWNRWKQRLFVNVSVAKQIRPLLDEPLFLESQYGLPGYKNNYVPGHLRAGVKAEWVFFSPLSIAFFKFAPFVFGNLIVFKNDLVQRNIPVVGGGIRSRNESLVFGTLELNGAYYLKGDLSGSKYSVGVRTNLRYRYKQEFIRRPDFVQVN
jgi:hypothetical protein